MKPVLQAIVLVDRYTPRDKKHSPCGRYRVGAKTEKEAVQLVRDAIGFGSIQFYYWEAEDAPTEKVAYKQVVKEEYDKELGDDYPFRYEEAKHACAPRKTVSIEEESISDAPLEEDNCAAASIEESIEDASFKDKGDEKDC